MATGSLSAQMERHIQATGIKAINLVQAKKFGLMAPTMRVVSSWVKSMGMGRKDGLMALCIQVNSLQTQSMVQEYTKGQMVVYKMAIGNTT